MSFAPAIKTRNVCVACAVLVGAFLVDPAAATGDQTCTLTELATAVDEVGVSLRKFNQDAMPKVADRMHQLGKKNGWPENEAQARATSHLHDTKIARFDEQAVQLLSKINELGPREQDSDTGPNTDCARIADLRAAGLELLAVMKAKAAHTLKKIDAELTQEARAPKTAPAPALAPTPSPPPAPKQTPDTLAARTPPEQPGPWRTDLMREPPEVQQQKGYSIEEIRDATRGFFGTISTNLATAVEHAFKNWGRPTAYVLGNDGGGAFLAGLRYGKGTLYLREGGRRKIYWHGPSIGYDIGAQGSRAMFLIYNLDNADQMYRNFTGIDGSAYIVGGVGIAYMQGGRIVMAPIRSGIGLRIGANLGYLRFTPTATWNPF